MKKQARTKKPGTKGKPKAQVDLAGARRLWTIHELIAYLNMPRSTVFMHIAMDKIPYVQLGRHKRFIPDEIEAMVKRLA